MRDHYFTLGVVRSASEREIVRAYRRLARRYHPDVSAVPTLELFLAVQQAYETLSDHGRRQRYDAELQRREHLAAPPPAPVAAHRVAAPPNAEPRPRPEPPDTEESTVALTLLAAAALALVAAVVLGNVVPGGVRFLWTGVCAVLGLAATGYARRLATRQLDALWRFTAHAGRRSLRRSGAAAVAYRRIRLADDLTHLADRAVLVAIPVVFLLVPR